MNNATLFDLIPSNPYTADDPRTVAKLAAIESMKNRPKKRAGRKPTEQLVSPAEHITLALGEAADEARAIRALLDAPALMPAHRQRLALSAKRLAAAIDRAESHFRLVKARCGHKDSYKTRRPKP